MVTLGNKPAGKNSSIDGELGGIEESRVKWDTRLRQGIEEIITALKDKSDLSQDEEKLIRKTARLVMDAHKDQTRKDGVTPYFNHQLQVTKKLISLFDVTDPRAIQISLLHDTREDQPEAYTGIIDELSATPPLMDGTRTNQIRLGVRLVSKLEGSKYEDKYREIDPSEKKTLLLLEYYERMLDPPYYYKGELDLENTRASPYGHELTRHIQLIKSSDLLTNCGDMLNLFLPEIETTKTAFNLPSKTITEILDVVIPSFIEKSQHLTTIDRKRFYDDLVGTLKGHSTIDLEKYPKAKNLKEAGEKALGDQQLTGHLIK